MKLYLKNYKPINILKKIKLIDDYYINTKNDFVMCLLVLFLLYLLQFIYTRYITLLFLPAGVTSVTTITDSSGNPVAPTAYSPTEYCMGAECCDTENTQWVVGQGCVAL